MKKEVLHTPIFVSLLDGSRIDLWLLSSNHSQDILNAWTQKNAKEMLRQVDSYVYPLCLVTAHNKDGNYWCDIISECGIDIPYMGIAVIRNEGVFSLGIGRKYLAYDIKGKYLLSEFKTDYPISNVFAVPFSTDVIVVTEIIIYRLKIEGDIVWEYWHKEQIEESWADNQILYFSDFEDMNMKKQISLKTGK